MLSDFFPCLSPVWTPVQIPPKTTALQVGSGFQALPDCMGFPILTLITVQPSWISLIDINLTKPSWKNKIVWFLFSKWLLAFIIVIRYKEYDQDGGSMIKVYWGFPPPSKTWHFHSVIGAYCAVVYNNIIILLNILCPRHFTPIGS